EECIGWDIYHGSDEGISPEVGAGLSEGAAVLMARLPPRWQEAEEAAQGASGGGDGDGLRVPILPLVNQAVAVIPDEVGVVAHVARDAALGCQAVQQVDGAGVGVAQAVPVEPQARLELREHAGEIGSFQGFGGPGEVPRVHLPPEERRVATGSVEESGGG